MPQPDVIRSPTAVEDLAAGIRETGTFALDFEFLWERTYRPVPCLAQVAVGDEVRILDPIEGAPLEPIAELVADPDVRTIMHAPTADLTLLSMHYGTRPANLVDVQLMAGFVGLGAGQSLATLLDRALRVRVAKLESVSDWQRRPLSGSQLRYAGEDVLHLGSLHDHLQSRAERLRRTAWIEEEHRRRYGPHAEFVTDPGEAWRKVKGGGRLTPRERAVLREVAMWRDAEASRRDRPASWVLQDRVLVDLARRRPTDEEGVDASRAAERLRPDQIRSLLAAVARGEQAPEITGPPPPPPDVADRVDVLAALGQLMVGVRAGAARLAAQLLATRGEVEAFMTALLTGQGPTGPLSEGWRRELAGDALIGLAEGRIALAPSTRPPYLTEVAASPADE